MKNYPFILFLLFCLAATANGLIACSSQPTNPKQLAAPNTPTPTTPSGHLIVLDHREYPDHQIMQLDVATSESTTLFSAPQFSWIYQIDVALDKNELLFAYSAPPSEGRGFFDRSAIYQLSLDDSDATPDLLFGGEQHGQFYYTPTRSPDGRFIYFANYVSDYNSVVTSYHVTLERYDVQTGESRVIAKDGIWPRVSPDNSHLTYIGVDPTTLQRGLYIARSDGSDATSLVPIGTFFDIDTPLFSPDGQWIYFTVAKEGPQTSWLDHLLGVNIASAHTDHNIPSDWWRIPVTGGEPEQLTHEPHIIIYGDFSPDGQHLAFSTLKGVYIMDADGSTLTQLKQGSTYGTLDWLP